jgi:mannose-6-phosphate isomerase-like protein (cupin superfamily)
MKTLKLSEAPQAPNPHGVTVQKLYDTEHALTMHLTLRPGEALKRHVTPVDVFFYVLEGEGVVEIGDERKTVGKDVLIDSPARIPHCWYNESERDVRILVVKVPRPVSKTQLL